MTENEKSPPIYPSNDKFVFDTPLYTSFSISADQEKVLVNAKSFTIDGYCPFCKTNRVFMSDPLATTVVHSAGHYPQGQARRFYFEDFLKFNCAKHVSHTIWLYVRLAQGVIQKLGQKPSYADIVTAEDAQLTKALDAQDRREYNKAIGLAAHDVGIGAYAYLRRIFERLIWTRFNLHKEENGWIEDDFKKLHMNEKISFLRAYLPPLLVSNGATYGILSNGLHNLSEEQCLAFFPILRKGILLILQQEVERLEREKNEAEFTRAISQFGSASKPSEP